MTEQSTMAHLPDSLTERGRPLSTPEVAELTGATLRQLDYGYRGGYLKPTGQFGGSGSRLQWSEHEVRVIARLVEVAKALPFITFAELASAHAPALRDGMRVVLAGPWGVFMIEIPDGVEPFYLQAVEAQR